MLNTILVPKNLHHLNNMLPSPKYGALEEGDEEEEQEEDENIDARQGENI